MRALDRMRKAIREQRYRISSHANEEMAEDDLMAEDLESIVLTGQIARKFTKDPRGTRYEVVGETAEGRQGCIVCRFLSSGVFLIITAYVEEG